MTKKEYTYGSIAKTLEGFEHSGEMYIIRDTNEYRLEGKFEVLKETAEKDAPAWMRGRGRGAGMYDRNTHIYRGNTKGNTSGRYFKRVGFVEFGMKPEVRERCRRFSNDSSTFEDVKFMLDYADVSIKIHEHDKYTRATVLYKITSPDAYWYKSELDLPEVLPGILPVIMNDFGRCFSITAGEEKDNAEAVRELQSWYEEDSYFNETEITAENIEGLKAYYR